LRLGYVALDAAALEKDLAYLLGVKFSDAYSEYALNDWKTCVLANRSGSASAAFSEEYAESAIVTEIGVHTPYLIALAQRVFAKKHIKSIRVFRSRRGGMIIPHIDYLEFDKGFHRFHIPIQTDATCLNSEENRVFNMQKGELWYLDGRRIHSAISSSPAGKMSLVVDCETQCATEELLHIPAIQTLPHDGVAVPQRRALPIAMEPTLDAIALSATPFNIQDTLQYLAKHHFAFEVDLREYPMWLKRISTRTSDTWVREYLTAHIERFFGSLPDEGDQP
jgi:hypothetical protein